MSARVLTMPPGLAAAVLQAAARAFPLECCGLIVGVGTPEGWDALSLHETANLAKEPARHFRIDEEVQFALLRSLRGTHRRIIGCFHSHPGGPAQPSATDLAGAAETDFVWLIAGGNTPAGFTLGAFEFAGEEEGFRSVELRRHAVLGF